MTPAIVFDDAAIYAAIQTSVQIPPTSVNDILSKAGGTDRDRQTLKALLLDFEDVFAWDECPLGRTNRIRHSIETGYAKPIWQPPRRIPVQYQNEVRELLDSMLATGEYKITCIYRSGKQHANADALSRRPPNTETREENTPRDEVNAVYASEPTRHHWAAAQSTDPDTAVVYDHLTRSQRRPIDTELRGSSEAAYILRSHPEFELEVNERTDFARLNLKCSRRSSSPNSVRASKW
ncbi:hypothetical protein SprV_0100077200 [Sparganum proliferum]